MRLFGSRKQRRPRGPNTPQARALLWEVFRREELEKAGTIGLPEAVWLSQESFEEFLRTGKVDDTQRWGGEAKQLQALRALVWRYREGTKRRFGAAFFERDDEKGRGLSKSEIVAELRRSDRWGVNEQPDDPVSLAEDLARLPVWNVAMKDDATLVVRFLRPLSNDEADLLLKAAHAEESPFTPGEPMLQAFLWWD